MIKCHAITTQGKRCKRSIVPEKDVCFQHIAQCRKDYKKYHRVCDQVWNASCDTGNTIEQNQKMSNKMKKCVQRRKGYMDDCVDTSCQDDGHRGAVGKIRGKRFDCSTIISNQEIERKLREKALASMQMRKSR